MSNMKEQDPVLKELRAILKVLLLANANYIEKEISKIATTNERKKIWVLIDGKRMPKDIAKETGVTQMAISYFLNAGVVAGLIEYIKNEPPRRIIDYVPAAWIDLVRLPSLEPNEEKTIASQNFENEGGVSDGEKN